MTTSNETALIKWSDEFCTHIRAIDEDHKGLFDVMNTLHDANLKRHSHDQINAVIVLINNYVNGHFDREERFMEQARYPKINEHRELHKQYRDDFIGLRSLYHNEPEAVDVQKAVMYLFSWLQNHILSSDMEYVPYLRGEKTGEPLDDSEIAQEKEFVHISVRVPSEKATLIENFIDVISDHDIDDDLERLMTEAYERKIARARSLFT